MNLKTLNSWVQGTLLFTLTTLLLVATSGFTVEKSFTIDTGGKLFGFYTYHVPETGVHGELSEGKMVFRNVDEVIVGGMPEYGALIPNHPVDPDRELNFYFNELLYLKPEVVAIETNRSRRVILNYPPVSSPWHWPAGVSQLTAILRKDGHQVMQRYGHLLGLEYVLKAQDLTGTETALAVIRDQNSDVMRLYEARMALEQISTNIATSDKFGVIRNNVHYTAGDYDGTIAKAIGCIKNRETSIWHDYFVNVEIPFVREHKPDLYGISINDERQIIPGFILASMVKYACPETLVVLGGNVWSRTSRAFRRTQFAQLFDFWDAIVYSEGYEPLALLTDTMDPSTTAGVVWRSNGKAVVNPKPKEPTKFSELPTSHFDGGARIWCPDNVVPLYTMSNCPQQCSYCAISGGSDTFLGVVRKMTPMQVAIRMKEHAPLGNRFDIFDETLPVGRQIAIGKALREIGHTATWQCYLTITDDLLRPERVQSLYDAGCRAVQLGLETLSSESLARENKTWNTPENYGQILKNLTEAGIQAHVFIIVGIPGEKMTDTLKWLPFIEDYGEYMLTIKPSRYRLTRSSPEESSGVNSTLIIPTPDMAPLRLNREFQYVNSSGRSTKKDVAATLLLVEEACRRHTPYPATSTNPWWSNRGRYSHTELFEMGKLLPQESVDPDLRSAIRRTADIVNSELNRKVKFRRFFEVVQFVRSLNG